MSVPALPLSPIEELDWYLENPGEPNLVQLETHVQGHLDQAVLARALAAVLAADPAARRRLAPAPLWRRHPRWEIPSAGDAGELAFGVAEWDSPEELGALRESLTTVPVSLRERALRLTLAAGPDHDVVFLQVHHAAFDGVSLLALLSAIGDAYRSAGAVPAVPGAVPAVPGAAPAAPSVTSECGGASATSATSAAGNPYSGKKILVDYLHPDVGNPPRSPVSRVPGAVTRIAGRRNGPARPGYGFAQWAAPVPTPPGPDRDGDADPRPTVNDLLVTALILTVHRWNAVHGRSVVHGRSAVRRQNDARRGRVSIAIPVNVRDPRHRWSGPGNQSRLIRVSARPADCEHPGRLLAAVSAQARAARERPRPGLDGASRTLAAGWAPAALKRVAVRLARGLAAPFTTDTALVSNLGLIPAPPSFADLDAPRPLWFAGPAPMPRGLGLAALTVGGRLHLTIAYSRSLFDPAAGADFAAAYRRVLAELAPADPEDPSASDADLDAAAVPDADPDPDPDPDADPAPGADADADADADAGAGAGPAPPEREVT